MPGPQGHPDNAGGGRRGEEGGGRRGEEGGGRRGEEGGGAITPAGQVMGGSETGATFCGCSWRDDSKIGAWGSAIVGGSRQARSFKVA